MYVRSTEVSMYIYGLRLLFNSRSPTGTYELTMPVSELGVGEFGNETN